MSANAKKTYYCEYRSMKFDIEANSEQEARVEAKSNLRAFHRRFETGRADVAIEDIIINEVARPALLMTLHCDDGSVSNNVSTTTDGYVAVHVGDFRGAATIRLLREDFITDGDLKGLPSGTATYGVAAPADSPLASFNQRIMPSKKNLDDICAEFRRYLLGL